MFSNSFESKQPPPKSCFPFRMPLSTCPSASHHQLITDSIRRNSDGQRDDYDKLVVYNKDSHAIIYHLEADYSWNFPQSIRIV